MKYATIAVVVLACALTAQASPVQWAVGSGGNGHFYEVVSVPGGVDWLQAKTAAENAGGYLATITSAEEDAFIADLLPAGVVMSYWLGGYQDPATGGANENWHWVTGETWLYTNWLLGEPNDGFSLAEDSLSIYGDSPERGKWNDVHNSYVMNYVVESVPEPATMALLSLGGLALLRKRREQ